MYEYDYKYQDLCKFDKETWIDYIDVFCCGTLFRHKIKNIPEWHIPSRFNLVSQQDVNILKEHKIEE